MSFPVRLKWSTASVGSSHAPTDAVDHSAPSAIRPESTYISGKVVQTNGATSDGNLPTRHCRKLQLPVTQLMNHAAIDEKESSALLWPDKADVLGVKVSGVDYDAAVSCIIDAAKSHRTGVVACHAVHAIVTASADKSLQEKVNRFSMITPDGQPVRWARNALHGAKLSDRVYGPELMRHVCHAAAAEGISIYLYGGTPEILASLEDNHSVPSPGPHIAGSEAPPFRELTDQGERRDMPTNQSEWC